MQADGPRHTGIPTSPLITSTSQTSSSGSNLIVQVEPLVSATSAHGERAGLSGEAWIDAVIVQEAARLRAMRTEARLLGDDTGSAALRGVRAYVQRRAAGGGAIIRGAQEKRHDLPVEQKAELLEKLCSPVREATPRTLLVVAHQDDECIGAGARLCNLDDAMIVHVTNGAPRDPEFARRAGYSNRDDYEEARKQEAADALRLAGIQPDQIVGLDMMDGEASYHLVELSLEIADLIDELKPDVVLTHPYEGGHTDHDATAFAVHLACGLLRRDGAPAPAVLELTSYHTQGGIKKVCDFLPAEGFDPRTILLTPEEQRLKTQMYSAYRSQQRCLDLFPIDVERFRTAPRYIFTRPPHPGRLNYERYSKRRPMTGDQWRDHARRALRALRAGRRLLIGGALFDSAAVTLTNLDFRVQPMPQAQPPAPVAELEVRITPQPLVDAA